MTPTEVADQIDWLEQRYPTTRNYRDIEHTYGDFSSIPAEALRMAAENYYNAGNKTAPSLSELRSEAIRIATQRGLIDRSHTSCEARGHHGNLAIVDLPGGMREAQCVDCETIWRKPAGQLPTAGERAQGARAPRVDQSPEQDALTERIAP
jgi:hypothetical protein